MAEQVKGRPIHELRIGSIKAAVWQNEGSSGPWYTVTFDRIYKEGDKWKSSPSFRQEDLLILSKLADQAHTWVVEQGSKAE